MLTIPSGVKTPVVIKADLKDNNQYIIKQNEIYVRTLNSNYIPSSSKAGWKDWARLMEICFDNREADIGRFLRRHLGGVDSKVIVETLNSLSVKPASSSSELVRAFRNECIARFDAVRSERQLDLPDHGAWEVALLIPHVPETHIADRNFLRLIESNNPQYSGWPCWLVSDRMPDIKSHPYHYHNHNRWEQFVVTDFIGIDIDYMVFDPRGRLYQRRALKEDLRLGTHPPTPLTQLEWTLPIRYIAKSIAVGLSFAKALGGTGNSEPLTFLFRWDKLKGRQLVSWDNFQYHFTPRGPSHQDTVESIVSVPLETPLHSIVDFVEKVIRQLFSIFDGYSPSRGNIERFARELLERR